MVVTDGITVVTSGIWVKNGGATVYGTSFFESTPTWSDLRLKKDIVRMQKVCSVLLPCYVNCCRCCCFMLAIVVAVLLTILLAVLLVVVAVVLAVLLSIVDLMIV